MPLFKYTGREIVGIVDVFPRELVDMGKLFYYRFQPRPDIRLVVGTDWFYNRQIIALCKTLRDTLPGFD